MNTKTKKLLSPETLFKRRNAAFKKATAAGKRVLIAKDALSQLTAKKIKPKSMDWVRWNTAKLNPEEQICTISDRVKCTACAYGAMMLSEIRFNNDFLMSEATESFSSPSYYLEGNVSGDRLRKFFSQGQLQLVEIAFELGKGYWRQGDGVHLFNRAVAFGERYSKLKDRMAAIFYNIIKNKGRFIP